MILLTALLPVIGGCILFGLPEDKVRRAADIVIIGSALVGIVTALCCRGMSFTGLKFLPTTPVYFALDEIGSFFMLLFAFVFGMVQLYAPGYMHHEGKEPQFYGFYAITLGTLFAVCMAKNAITFYMCFEFMSICSMPLVLHNGSEISRLAAFKYLGYSTLGASLALLGMFIATTGVNSLEFTAGGTGIMAGTEAKMLVAFFLIFIGFGAKAGLVPLQMWLTEAHPVAPSPASAVLSGIITKSGVLAIIRFTFFIFGADFVRGTWVQTVLLVIVLCTIFMGSMLAYKEKVLKKRMAYSTISNVSYVLLGVLTLSSIGFVGALLQVTFHALAKDILFLSAGSIILKTGCTRVDQLKGIGRRMPVTLWCLTIAAISLIGIPPFGGFVSKWYLCLGGFELSTGMGIAAMTVLMISALLTAFYLLSITADAFFPGRDFEAGEKCEVSRRMLIPSVTFAALLLIIGLAPNWLIQIFSAISGTIL